MSKLFQELVEKRGYSEDFLSPKYEKLASPFLLPDMRRAVERIKRAIEGKEKILIYGDYDVDGVTASAVMNDALKLAGLEDIEIMLPDRFKDGYGMSKKVVQEAKEQGRTLVITVDCGSGRLTLGAIDKGSRRWGSRSRREASSSPKGGQDIQEALCG